MQTYTSFSLRPKYNTHTHRSVSQFSDHVTERKGVSDKHFFLALTNSSQKTFHQKFVL